MKKLALILLAVVMALSLAACAGGSEPAGNNSNTDPSQAEAAAAMPSETGNENEQPSETPDAKTDAPSASEPSGAPEGSKILVAYFSATNNTEGVAQKLADGLGADLYEIVPEQPYTDEDLDYGNSKSRSSVEMNDPNARPAISGSVENMEQYDTVLLGYPIWWGEAPRIMSTFIESYDFDRKTLVAFSTSASSGFGRSDSALKSATGTATLLEGHRFSAGASAEDVLAWAAYYINKQLRGIGKKSGKEKTSGHCWKILSFTIPVIVCVLVAVGLNLPLQNEPWQSEPTEPPTGENNRLLPNQARPTIRSLPCRTASSSSKAAALQWEARRMNPGARRTKHSIP